MVPSTQGCETVWIFTKVGFFSVVESSEPSPNGEDLLSVRARIEGDLDRLRNAYAPKLGPTVILPGRDYPYRAYVTKEGLSEAMVRMTLDIDYGNFKNMVTQVFGHARHSLYAKVWSVMFGAEQKVGKEKAA